MRYKPPLPPHRVLTPPGGSLAEAVCEHLRDRLLFDREQTEVLDCGCGSGRLARLLSPYVRRLTAVDATPEMISPLSEDLAAGRYRNIRACAHDLADVARAFYGARFDLVLSSLTCHHALTLENFLSGLKSLLKPDGVLCIIDLNLEDGSFHLGDETVPYNGFSPENFCALLAEIGYFSPTAVTVYTIKRPTPTAGDAMTPREYPVLMFLADNAAPRKDE